MPISRMFGNAEDATQAVDELKKAGYEADTIHVFSKSTAGGTAGLLMKQGVGEVQAHRYAERIDGGETFLIMNAPFGGSARAAEILERPRPGDSATPSLAYETRSVDWAAPLSSALGWRVLARDPAPLSSWLGWKLLSDKQGPGETSHGAKILSDNPAPLSSWLGWKLLSDKAAPFSAWIGRKVLIDDPAPFSKWLGRRVLSDNVTPLSSWLGWKTLSSNPAPLSSWLGLRVLSKDQ